VHIFIIASVVGPVYLLTLNFASKFPHLRLTVPERFSTGLDSEETHKPPRQTEDVRGLLVQHTGPFSELRLRLFFLLGRVLQHPS
jgi:hypothetical protein